MATRITKTDVVECIKEGGKLVGQLALDIYGETLNQTGEEAFSEAIEVGIQNTIAALYDANVKDTDILRVVNTHWGLSVQEIENRLIWEKRQATIRSLKQYLRLQGYSKSDVDDFMKEHKAAIKINHSNDLWKLKDNPEKLITAIKSSN